jgi:hypothetical protein
MQGRPRASESGEHTACLVFPFLLVLPVLALDAVGICEGYGLLELANGGSKQQNMAKF